MRALLSVWDKRGIVDFARGLVELGMGLLSTGGTARTLREAGLAVEEVSAYTGFPEMLDGRVKSLHPRVHGGILFRRDDPRHREQLQQLGIEPIDLVAVNLYPFERTVEAGCSLQEALEQIDIGGPTLVRAAAKNFPHVTVVVDPGDYRWVLERLRSGGLSLAERRRLAQKAFAHTAAYDVAIQRYLAEEPFPERFFLVGERALELRYGENPHQRACLYRERGCSGRSALCAEQLQGKALSFNNILDVDAALGLVGEFEEPTAVVIKHSNPCGVGQGEDPLQAYLRARECDPVSAFGGIVALNRPVDGRLAEELTSTFLEVVAAPEFSPEALQVLRRRPDLRVLRVPWEEPRDGGWDVRRVAGGFLVQERDLSDAPPEAWRVVTRRAPTPEELRALWFAWRVCKHVRSNAVVFANGCQTVGIGAGQMSRVDAVRIAAQKALLPLRGTVLASEALFPFRDSVDLAHQAGATAIAQPGGSVRDEEVIAAADEHGMAMVFTGVRHFRH